VSARNTRLLLIPGFTWNGTGRIAAYYCSIVTYLVFQICNSSAGTSVICLFRYQIALWNILYTKSFLEKVFRVQKVKAKTQQAQAQSHRVTDVKELNSSIPIPIEASHYWHHQNPNRLYLSAYDECYSSVGLHAEQPGI